MDIVRSTTQLFAPLLLLLLGSCAPPGPQLDEIAGLQSLLTGEERVARATLILEAARAHGLNNGLLLAGIADAETGMSHCWSELTWACMGPDSVDCAGPVVAGAGDGPCVDRQGGLGMFQFDAGTYDETLAREGERILTIDGNVAAAIDFVLSMVVRSVYIDGVDTDEQAIEWLEGVRPWNELWTPWIQTVTHYYNGCRPDVCGVYDSRIASYSGHGTDLVAEMGMEFWYGEVVPCGEVPAEGTVIDEVDACFTAGGPAAFWRSEDAGFGGSLLWTNATASDAPANFAQWDLWFAEAGSYLLEAYTDAAWAVSVQTSYRIEHGGTSEQVVVDQSALDGFQELGVFDFVAGGGQRVRVDDNTGETASDVHIVADALRLTRVDFDDGGVPDAGAPDAMLADGGGLPDGGLRPGPTSSGGCAVGAVGSASGFGWLVLLGLWLGRRRRR